MKTFYYIIILIFFIPHLILTQTTYIWIGGVNTNFSTPGNWSPLRQIGRTNDRLIFNNGQNNAITGVNQVTFAQLVIKDNTVVTLSPGSGNARIIYLDGILDAPNGNPSGYDTENDIATLKYNEYKEADTVKDLATLKYDEYKTDGDIQKNDLASIKYDEYKNPAVTGMGDIKVSNSGNDNPMNNNIYIEFGSSLKIIANDPSLSMYLKANAKAEIFGTLILEGQIQNSINSHDPFSIRFKSGSKLIQKCPGNIFNTTGANNSAVFESGSVLDIQSSTALSPFALEPPFSKVVFEENSKVVMNSTSSNALKLSGRIYSDLEINSNLVINEIIIGDCFIRKLLINPSASFTVNSLNNSSTIPSINIKGDLVILGNLDFPVSTLKKLNIKFNGSAPQSISGNGITNFNSSIDNIFISNDLNINRELFVRCNVIHNNGVITCIEHTFTVNGNFTSPFAVPIGIIIQSQRFSNGNTHDGKQLPGEEGLADNKDKDKLSVFEASGKIEPVPTEYSLSQNYPNPFNPSTTIEFGLPIESNVILKVFDIKGSEVSTLASGMYKAGKVKINFDGSNLATGVYFYRIIIQNASNTITKVNKMILSK